MNTKSFFIRNRLLLLLSALSVVAGCGVTILTVYIRGL